MRYKIVICKKKNKKMKPSQHYDKIIRKTIRLQNGPKLPRVS